MTQRDDRYRAFIDKLDGLRSADSLRALRTVESRDGTYVTIDGRRLLDLSSNDYLGLACDRDLVRAFYREMDPPDPIGRFGPGGSSSRLLAGNSARYDELERDLAARYGAGRAALVFASGYHANTGAIPALAGKGDLIISDALNHASIIDGVRLSGAECRIFRHRDCGHAGDLLAGRGRPRGRALIVTESIFSMDGDAADLPALAAIARRHGALLYVDEAHAVGVFGAGGLGLCERDLPEGGADIVVGTFGKALGGLGAFAVADPAIRDWLINRARTLIFSTALPPVVLSWDRYAFGLLPSLADRRARLLDTADRLRAALAERSLATGGESQIVPVVLGDNRSAIEAARLLMEAGYLALPIRPPAVPEGSARLRLSLRADMDWRDLMMVPDILEKARG